MVSTEQLTRWGLGRNGNPTAATPSLKAGCDLNLCTLCLGVLQVYSGVVGLTFSKPNQKTSTQEAHEATSDTSNNPKTKDSDATGSAGLTSEVLCCLSGPEISGRSISVAWQMAMI